MLSLSLETVVFCLLVRSVVLWVFLRLAPELPSVASLLFCFFLLILPKAPQYIIVYSSCECLWLCYMGHHLSVAWWAVLGPRPGSKQVKPWATKTECELNHLATGQAPLLLLLHRILSPHSLALGTVSLRIAQTPWTSCPWAFYFMGSFSLYLKTFASKTFEGFLGFVVVCVCFFCPQILHFREFSCFRHVPYMS